jgi:hypothetical protein
MDREQAYFKYKENEELFVQIFCSFIYPDGQIVEGNISRFIEYNINVQKCLLKHIIINKNCYFNEESKRIYNYKDCWKSLKTLENLYTVIVELSSKKFKNNFYSLLHSIYSEEFLKELNSELTEKEEMERYSKSIDEQKRRLL